MDDSHTPKKSFPILIRRTLIFFIVAFPILLYALSTLRTIAPISPRDESLRWWIGSSLVVVGVLLLIDMLVQLAWRRMERRRPSNSITSPPQMDRRRFIAGLAVPTAAVAVGGVGVMGSRAPFRIFREDIQLRGLPHILNGFRIGLITDPHIGDWCTPERLAQAVDALNEAKVDLQIMGGDLIDDLALLDPTFAALERCRAPYGMLAVLGNHEKIGHMLPPILAAYEHRKSQGQIQLMVDSHFRLDHRGAPLWIVGVDYPMHPGGPHNLPPAEHEAFMRATADKAFQGVPVEEPVLCLSHHPAFFPLAAERGAWLTLAGHMHGGQWAMFGHPLIAPIPYMRGRYQRGAAQLYVSCGLGDWLPCRIGVPHEVTVLTLTRAA